MKSFELELQDLYPGCDIWTNATVEYSGDRVISITDEFGRVWELKELSIFDLARIGREMPVEPKQCESFEEYLEVHNLKRYG